MRGFATAITPIPQRYADKTWSSVSMDQLCSALTAGHSLPKDAFLETDLAGLYSNPYRRRDRNVERSALHALTAPHTSADQHTLALKIANCTKGNRCGRLTCFICKQRYWRTRRNLLTRLDPGYPDHAISWVTIIIGHSQSGYPPIRRMITGFKAAFSNALSHIDGLAWSGRIEIDYLDPLRSTLQPEKVATLTDLRWDPLCEMATLVPHAHFVLAHPAVHRATLAYNLRRTFAGSRRVQLKPFRITRERSDTLDNLARYSIKPFFDKAFLAGRGTKSHRPRHPEIIRYLIRVHEALDHPERRALLEFDHLL